MDDTFTISLQGNPRTIKMHFGLLNVLCKAVGQIEDAAVMALDNDLREIMLIELLSERDAKGLITEPLVVFTLDASADEVSRLLGWAQEHILDFFLKEAEKTSDQMGPIKIRVDALKLSSTGGAPSPSKKPSL